MGVVSCLNGRSNKGALRPLRGPVAAVLAVMMLMATVIVVPSARADDSSSVPFPDHVVGNTVNPSGTTIDLFDYWVQPYGCADTTDSYDPCSSTWFDHSDTGINNGKQLHFTYGGETYDGQSTINKWTYSASPRKGMVKSLLEDGYPVIAADQLYSWRGYTTDGTQSLNYLFDTTNTDMSGSKYVYPNVTGMLQLQDGYYVYDSTKNYVALNDTTAGKTSYSMSLYDTPGVNGEFFPFNSASDVFNENSDGTLSNKVSPMDSVMNHYFGMHSQSEFMQPVNGLVNDKAMVFDFSGDDDVWVFIDGVLVGDVGGIHNSAALDINFQTGVVKVKSADGATTYTNTTIRQMFANAYGEDSDEFKNLEWSATNTNTFADGTYHTLDFFYLERGNNESNLKVKYNLADIPGNNLIKLDQQGNRVAGASFELYKAGSDYSYTAADLICKGTTDKDGIYQFTNYETGKPVNFADLARNGRGITHYVLKETSAPPGYRKSSDILLRYQIGATGDGLLLCNEEEGKWESGAWSVANETMTVANGTTVYGMDGTAYDTTQGKVFAVILQRNKTDTGTLETDTWSAVTGNALEGWELSENVVDDTDSIAELADSDAVENTNYLHFFGLDSEGKYSASISSLPGDIFTYYFMRSDSEKADALYSIGAYYTTADSVDGITADNTVRLDTTETGDNGQQFLRSFGVQIAITDVRNAPIVQKVDDAGNPVEGAEFSLYTADQVSEDGTTLLDGATALQTCVTANTSYPYEMKGSCMFGMKGSSSDGVEDSGVDLDNGTYYVKETSAPEGYEINDTLVKLLITDNGIYADAGNEDDGVSTMTHVGTINQVLKQFAANRSINRTLSDLTVTQMRCADEECVTNGDWSETIGSESKKAVDVSWTGNFKDGYYTLADQTNITDDGFVNTTGWTYFNVNQAEDKGEVQGTGARFTLKDADLERIFTGANVIRVQDQRKASLTLTKKVTVGDGYDKPDDFNTQQFSFNITLSADDAAKLQQDGETDYYYGTISGGAGDGKLDDAQSVVLKLVRDSEDSTSGQLVRCVAKGDTDEEQCAKTENVKLSNRQTLSVANISDGVSYKITEESLPKGYVFEDAKSSNLTGTIQRSSGTSAAVVGNTYQPNSIILVADQFVAAVKRVVGLPDGSTGSYPFEFQLQASQDTPLPACDAQSSENCSVSDVDANGNHVMKKTLTYQASGDASQSMTFGDITFTKPGTYTYLLSETMPSSGALEGFNYSRAQYTVTVTVAVKDGDLAVTKVETVQTYDDSGTAVSGATVEDNKAEFTNNYSKDPRAVTFFATKNYTENGYPYQAGMFSTKLTAVGSYSTSEGEKSTVTDLPTNSSDVPMPSNIDGSVSVDASFDAFHTASFPSVSFKAEHGDHTYVYKVTENADTVTDAGSAMTYDSTAYYVFVAVTVTDGVVNANVSYYKADDSGALTKVDVPEDGSNPIQFTNTYVASEVVTAPEGAKTLTGRARTETDSFSFKVTAADEATENAVTNGYVSGADCDSSCAADSTLVSATSTKVTADPGESKSFKFTNLTFRKAGTYKFNIVEDPGDIASVTYDDHKSTVTYVISDADENGKHTGKLKVESVTYNNRSSSTTDDRKVTDKAAFTNAYHATAAFSGIEVTKALHNSNAGTTRNLYAGEFAFTISGKDDDSTQRISAGTFSGDRKFSNEYAAGSEAPSSGYGSATNTMTKLTSLVFNESDIGKTYTFEVKELPQHTNPNTGEVNTELDSDYVQPSGENAKDVKIDGIWFKQWIYTVKVTVSDNGDGTLNVNTSKSVLKGDDSTATVSDIKFVNTYEKLSPKTIDSTADSAPLYKQLSGRDWSYFDRDRFTFTVEKCNYSTNAGSYSDVSSIVCTTDTTTLGTLPDPSNGTSVTVGKSDVVTTKAGDFAKIGFGSFTFSKPGAYVYKVTETAGNDTTLTYATNVRYLRFRVEEDQMKGVYSVIVTTPGYNAPTATDANDEAAFVNVCKSAEHLPLTGGLTTRNYLASGLVMGLLAIFAGFAIHEWWRRQQRKEQLLE